MKNIQSFVNRVQGRSRKAGYTTFQLCVGIAIGGLFLLQVIPMIAGSLHKSVDTTTTAALKAPITPGK